MPLIRSLLLACSLASLLPLLDAGPADAQSAVCRPWCRERSDGARNCGFVSYEQCMQAAYGADICVPNGACPPPGRTPLRHGR
jgi:Protein of unknown function (DUF3551)